MLKYYISFNPLKRGNVFLTTVQEVEARGTNFAFKTNADSLMMNGRFDNTAVNKAIQNSTKSSHTDSSGTQENKSDGFIIGKDYSYINQDGTTNQKMSDLTKAKAEEFDKNWAALKNYVDNLTGKRHTDGEFIFTLMNNDSVGAKAGSDSNFISSLSEGAKKLMASVGLGISGNSTHGDGASYKFGGNRTTGGSKDLVGSEGEKFDIKESLKHGYVESFAKNHTENASISDKVSETKDYKKTEHSGYTDSYDKTQSDSNAVSHNSIAATMNAEMMANGGANMSFEERLSYLTNRMSEIGNLTANMNDPQEINNKLNLGIEAVENTTKTLDINDLKQERNNKKNTILSNKNKLSKTNVADRTGVSNKTMENRKGEVINEEQYHKSRAINAIESGGLEIENARKITDDTATGRLVKKTLEKSTEALIDYSENRATKEDKLKVQLEAQLLTGKSEEEIKANYKNDENKRKEVENALKQLKNEGKTGRYQDYFGGD